MGPTTPPRALGVWWAADTGPRVWCQVAGGGAKAKAASHYGAGGEAEPVLTEGSGRGRKPLLILL